MPPKVHPEYQRIQSSYDNSTDHAKSSKANTDSAKDESATGVAGVVEAPASILLQDDEVAHSEWYHGWGTYSLTLGFTTLAIICAVGHYFFCRYLHGKSANGDAGFFSKQNYTTAVSNCFSAAFHILLIAALSSAFTQHLWSLLRTKPLKVSTIEALFILRSDPRKFLHGAIFRHAYVLAVISLLIYLAPFGAQFAPGALVVIPTSPNVTTLTSVPTYNSSYTGNGTLGDLQSSSFGYFQFGSVRTTSATTWNVSISAFSNAEFPSPLRRLAAASSFAGQQLAIDSPCGPNCTYTFEFEGPSLNCSTTIRNRTVPNFLSSEQHSHESKTPAYYDLISASYLVPEDNSAPGASNALNLSVLNIPQISYPVIDLSSEGSIISILVTETNLTCIPYRSLYSVTNSYTNNVQSLNYTVVRQLEQLSYPAGNNYAITLNGTMSQDTNVSNTDYSSLDGILWNEESLLWFRNCQMMGIYTGILQFLGGEVSSLFQQESTNNTDTVSDVYWSSIALETSGSGGPLLPYTAFNDQFQNWKTASFAPWDEPTSFSISQESVNKLVGDYVLSTIPAYGNWSQTINVTQFPSQNVYSFEESWHLTVSYGIILAIALPLIARGLLSLHRNGIPANDGGFIQLVSTTTGSASLRAAAASNCLGGGDKITKSFANMKIKFGEVVDCQTEHKGVIVRRAGFGTEDEVIPLIKGEKYGMVGQV